MRGQGLLTIVAGCTWPRESPPPRVPSLGVLWGTPALDKEVETRSQPLACWCPAETPLPHLLFPRGGGSGTWAGDQGGIWVLVRLECGPTLPLRMGFGRCVRP